MSKQYGLILPKNSKDHPILPVTKSHSIFNEDSDSDTPSVFKPSGSQVLKKQDQINQKKAVEEDPTVYQYDEIYDDMEQQRKEVKLAKKSQDKKPKYINRLLATAEKRKRENERRIERQVQKEREQEGDMYKDKESFVTSAYKQKLEEMKKLEEEEKREEYLESIGDVRKQGNLDGFYRHLYDQKVNYEDKLKADIKDEVKQEPNSESENETGVRENTVSDGKSPLIHSPKAEIHSESSNSDASEGEDKSRRKRKLDVSKDQHLNKKNKSRNYRRRKHSDEESDKNEDIEIKKEHLPSNLDADSDFSIDSSDSEDENKTIAKNNKELNENTNETIKETKVEDNTTSKEDEDLKNDIHKEEPKKEKPPEIQKPKIDIWKKRTVGEKFDEAVKRYFERKAQREMGL